jgi:Coenzyme PQQ synthesis protein D (PqqD)
MPLNNPKRRTDLVVERAGREALIYSSAESGAGAESGGAIHALNATAAFIWDRCDGAHSLAEIARAVRAQFAVPADRDLVVDVQ